MFCARRKKNTFSYTPAVSVLCSHTCRHRGAQTQTQHAHTRRVIPPTQPISHQVKHLTCPTISLQSSAPAPLSLCPRPSSAETTEKRQFFTLLALFLPLRAANVKFFRPETSTVLRFPFSIDAQRAGVCCHAAFRSPFCSFLSPVSLSPADPLLSLFNHSRASVEVCGMKGKRDRWG